jgi:FkbM family methyltransferase
MLPGQILTHPWLFTRKAAGRLRRRMVSIPPAPVVRSLNGSVRYEFKSLPFLDEGDLRAMLTGSYDLILCDNFKKFLRPGDVVLDVGANVGYISAMAATRVGPSGEVHGFEPLPECFERLSVLQKLNPQYKFRFNNLALGEAEGELPISYDPNGGSRNATLVPDHASAASRKVPVQRLDAYISQNIANPERIKLVKIDVEGFEFPVLRGMEQFLANPKIRPIIVCELKPWEVQKLGFSLEDLEKYMLRFGYRAYDSVDHGKVIDLTKMVDMDVVLFKA